MSAFHPDLRSAARWLPRGAVRAWSLGMMSRLPFPAPRLSSDVSLQVRALPDTSATVRIITPVGGASLKPAVLWIHGGGYVIGSAKQDELGCASLARKLDAVVLSVDYRLAARVPFPAAHDDCLAAWTLLHEHAQALGIDPARTVIAGQSAGGGLAAGLVLRLVDEHRPLPSLQVLVYPMLDDRTVQRAAESPHFRLWDPKSNELGWSRYLGRAPGGPDVSDYAAPGRREDLRGVPPTWLGVGSLDLFLEEDRAYVTKLRAAQVPVEVEEVDGAFHGFEAALPRADVSRRFIDARVNAMQRALSATSR